MATFQNVADLVTDRALATPGAIAVRHAELTLTYAELHRAAGTLAARLRDLGVGPETTVALRLPRSADLIVAALAVLQAGAAYVPVDPSYPLPRQRYLIGDSSASVLVTRGPAAEVAGDTVVVDLAAPDDPARPVAGPRDALARPTRPTALTGPTLSHPDALAYVIYTSGSTGQPKGVEVTHRGLANLVAWHRSAFSVTASDRASLVAGVGFDASVWEIWPYLAAGATLAIPPASTPFVPARLRDFLVREGISIAFVPTALAEALIELPWPADADLRILLTGGDRLHRRPPAGLPFRLVNNYGPTETTVVATSGDIPAGHGEPDLGTGIDGATVYVLDASGRPQPPGEFGEVYIGGLGVARGYRGRPQLTAQRFLPDPFGPPGSRLYRTGDLAAWRIDGTLEFAGRLDAQVQVRGHRVELGEVEAALAAHPSVRSAVVVGATDATGEVALTGFVVARDGRPPHARQLREHLRERLPAAMVPANFVIMTELPTTANGKVDRQALIAAAAAGPAPRRDGPDPTAARTATEAAVLATWRDVLGRPDIGVEDRFDELGGHSLAAARVIGRIAGELGVDLPLDVFLGPVTVAVIAALVADLTTDQPHRPLRRDAEGWAIPPARPGGATAAGDSDPLPVSFSQRRLWFFDRLVPGSSLYHIPLSFAIDGAVNAATLERAINEVVARHEPLRTHFDERDGDPVQIVEPARTIPLIVVDLRSAPAQRRTELVREHAREPFDLQTGPVLRALLLQLADDRYELLLTVHHIAFDGWSVGVFLSELGELYAAQTRGHMPPLPALPVSYRDVSVWQHKRLPEVLDGQLGFWRKQLDPPPPPLRLPTDRPRPATPSYRGDKIRHPLPPELLAALGGLGRQSRASLFMVMFAAFQVLLHRYTEQTDIATGVPVAGRDHPDTESLIGFFTNTVPVRVDLAGDPTFADVLDRVRHVVIDAAAHADVPLEHIVENVRPDRQAGFNPLFQVLFVMLNTPNPVVEVDGVRIRLTAELDNGCAKFDLLLFVDLPPQGPPVLTAEFATDLFHAVSVERLLANYERLLHSVVANPDRRISQLDLIAERDRAIVLPGPRPARQPAEHCLHALVEQQAELIPDAVAVEFDGSGLTYAELDRRGNQLGHYLRSAGVGPDVPVALCLDRSLDLAVAVLGILKAGGAYVPLDPSYPPARLEQILSDVAAPVLLTQQDLLGRLGDLPGRVVCLDAGWADISDQPETAPRSGGTPDNLAYVLFTSGSTGRPKGVAMPHRPIVNLIDWQRQTGGLADPKRTLQFAAIGFDVSCQEMFSTWATGGTLVFVRDEVRRDMAALLRFLDAAAVQRLFLPFVALQHLAEAAQDRGRAPAQLHEIITAGEQLHITPHVAWLMTALPGGVLHNHYGPTETHVATAHLLAGDPAHWPALPPVGTAIAGATTRILDRRGQPVPVGVPGELYLGGTCLARGYLNRPDLTAERFVPDPFSPDPGQRLYRTGDLARYRPDATIEFLGRSDDQVKIRGHRVELGEVEATLARNPAVRGVAVAVRQRAGAPDAPMLVAYVIPASPVEPGGEDALVALCRAHVEAHLPEYMVPSAVVLLDTLPLTPSGKLDRRALPEPPALPLGAADPSLAPATPVEAVIALVWTNVLGIGAVGRHDDFFGLGGHSLIATRMLSRLREALDIDVALQTLFANPTIAGLAAALRTEHGDGLVEEAELFVTVASLPDVQARAMLVALAPDEAGPPPENAGPP